MQDIVLCKRYKTIIGIKEMGCIKDQKMIMVHGLLKAPKPLSYICYIYQLYQNITM
jgi:hypothetical protein